MDMSTRRICALDFEADVARESFASALGSQGDSKFLCRMDSGSHIYTLRSTHTSKATKGSQAGRTLFPCTTKLLAERDRVAQLTLARVLDHHRMSDCAPMGCYLSVCVLLYIHGTSHLGPGSSDDSLHTLLHARTEVSSDLAK